MNGVVAAVYSIIVVPEGAMPAEVLAGDGITFPLFAGNVALPVAVTAEETVLFDDEGFL